MYLKADCPHCGRTIRKIGPVVFKPGIVTCPGCGRLSFVTGETKWIFLYLLYMITGAVILKPIIHYYHSDLVTVTLICALFVSAVWLFSTFLELRK